MNEFGIVLENVDLKNKNTYGIGGKTKYFISPYKDKISDLLNYLEMKNIPWYILGKGSNVLLPDKDFEGAIISLDQCKNIEIKDDLCFIDAGCPLSQIVKKTLEKGYVNLYFLASIPGSLGAAINGNVGCDNHEIFEFVKSVTIIDEKKQKITLLKEEIKHAYRETEFKKRKIIIIDACLELILGDVKKAQEAIEQNFAKRKNTQPLGEKNAGSVFKNPPNQSAGWLIENAGLKGYSIGDAYISQKHANFIINKNNATQKDILKLIKKIKEEIKEKYNITLELEQIIVEW